MHYTVLLINISQCNARHPRRVHFPTEKQQASSASYGLGKRKPINGKNFPPLLNTYDTTPLLNTYETTRCKENDFVWKSLRTNCSSLLQNWHQQKSQQKMSKVIHLVLGTEAVRSLRYKTEEEATENVCVNR